MLSRNGRSLVLRSIEPRKTCRWWLAHDCNGSLAAERRAKAGGIPRTPDGQEGLPGLLIAIERVATERVTHALLVVMATTAVHGYNKVGRCSAYDCAASRCECFGAKQIDEG